MRIFHSLYMSFSPFCLEFLPQTDSFLESTTRLSNSLSMEETLPQEGGYLGSGAFSMCTKRTLGRKSHIPCDTKTCPEERSLELGPQAKPDPIPFSHTLKQ